MNATLEFVRRRFSASGNRRLPRLRAIKRLPVIVAIGLAAVAPGVADAVSDKPSHRVRGLAECIQDLAGNGSHGALYYDTEFFLSLQSINLSEWDGNHDYIARRYDSGFNQTYIHVQYVDSGAAQGSSYGTSGNVSRRTTIETGNSNGLSSWNEYEYSLC